MYSLPPGVTATCDTSKSYHFWMNAYLSRDSVLAGHSPQGAAAAAYSLSKLYPIFGNLTNRSMGAIFKHPTFSPATQIVRADLAYATAGALYGANIKGAINIDQGISTLIDNSRIVSGLGLDQLRETVNMSNFYGYSRFGTMFSPNSFYNSIPKEFSPVKKAQFSQQIVNKLKPLNCRK